MANNNPNIPTNNRTRISELEKILRISEAAQFLLRGHNRYQLIEYFTKKYDYAISTISEYYISALEFIREASKEEIKNEIGYEIQRLEDLYRDCLQSRDKATAIKVANSIADLKGFQAITKVELENEANTGKVNITIVQPK